MRVAEPGLLEGELPEERLLVHERHLLGDMAGHAGCLAVMNACSTRSPLFERMASLIAFQGPTSQARVDLM
jgi:hypothetical protein